VKVVKNIPIWFFLPFKRIIDFNGRSGRSEFWTFAIINTILLFAFYYAGETSSMFNFLAKIYTLIIIVPGIAVGIRRLHDTGKSGWWLLLLLIILIGLPVLIYFFIQESQQGSNEYGANPLDQV
jgi:uncharacterized membrane protein YhaH (DUF805 family)